MNIETAINLKGTVVEVATTPNEIMFKKGEQFKDEMANTLQVTVDGKDMMLAQARRIEMHDKLDNWIDGVEE
jgi:CRISPR/Cas system-associated protein Cas10 (large subunit of type III CRISPR-Cas system)